MADQAREDIDVTRRWAVTLLSKVAVQEGQGLPLPVMDAGRVFDQWLMLHGTYARRVLRALDADVGRLRAAAAGCRDRHAQLSVGRVPHPKDEVYLLGAELADIAAVIVGASGMDPDAGWQAREAVMDEADLWLAHLECGGRGYQRWARIRRWWALARDAVRRRRGLGRRGTGRDFQD